MRRLALPFAVVVVWIAVGCRTDPASRTATLTIPVGQLASSPVPTLTRSLTANSDPASLLFLRLAEPPSNLKTAGDDGYVPLLAESWLRRDSLTLVFSLDPEARWHDGMPVTARDVVFTFDRARDPALGGNLQNVLRPIAAVTAEDERTVVITFERPYTEQMYTATFQVQVLPAHLLAAMPPDSVGASGFVHQPVGNGPYRFGELVPGQRLVLEAYDDFFLGRPAIDRIVFLLAEDADARLNLLLSGEANAMSGVSVASVERVADDPDLAVYTVPTLRVGYLLFNQHDPEDLDRAHPTLADVRVRRAITMALDRQRMLEAVFGEYATLPHGPVAALHWIRDPDAPGIPYDPEGAKALLEDAGWKAGPGGALMKAGQPLAFRLNYPSPSRVRTQLAQLVQEQLRQIGITVELAGLEGGVWSERRANRNFDIDFSSAAMDPSPSGLTQSWSCAGVTASNVARYCNRRIDSLLDAAIYGRGNTLPAWREVLTVIGADAPAVFMYSPSTVFGIDRRFGNVDLPPYAKWSHVWRWTVDDVAQTTNSATR